MHHGRLSDVVDNVIPISPSSVKMDQVHGLDDGEAGLSESPPGRNIGRQTHSR